MPTVVFDGACNLCNASVNFLLDHDRGRRLTFASNQSEAGVALLQRFGVDPADVSTVYLVDDERIYSRSLAAIRISEILGFPWRMATIFRVIPSFWRDGVYNWVARNRYRWFGKSESCRVATPEERSRFL